jgi:CBS-domain-containing membrane protein
MDTSPNHGRRWESSRFGRDLVGFTLAGGATALAVGILEIAAMTLETPYWRIPFITSIALVISLPQAEASRRRALIGGHIVATLVGYAVLFTAGSSPEAAAIATGLSVLAMLVTRTMHPPAAVDPFLVVNERLGLDFLFGTILPGAVLLAAFAWFWNRVLVRRWVAG